MMLGAAQYSESLSGSSEVRQHWNGQGQPPRSEHEGVAVSENTPECRTYRMANRLVAPRGGVHSLAQGTRLSG